MNLPVKPSLQIGVTGTVTISYSDLTSLLRYVEELERVLTDATAHERQAAQATLAGSEAGRKRLSDTLKAALTVAAFAAERLHPGMREGIGWPALNLAGLADGVINFFGDGSPEADQARVLLEFAEHAQQYDAYRPALDASLGSPCKTCGCRFEQHEEDPGDVNARGHRRTGDPTKRGRCRADATGHVSPAAYECARFEPSVPMPPLPPL